MPETKYTATQSYDDYTRTDKVSTFGGETDLWGAELTPEMLNDPDFAVIFDADVGAGLLRVDDVKVEVFFTLPTGQYDPDGLPPWASSGLIDGCIGTDADSLLLFVVVGINGTIKTSSNGTDWTEQDSGVAETLRGVTYGDGEFVAVGDNGVILRSSDSVTWTQEISDTQESLSAALYDPKARAFVAAGANGVIRRAVSASWARIRR